MRNYLSKNSEVSCSAKCRRHSIEHEKCMVSGGNWLTVLMRGVQLNSLTPQERGHNSRLNYTHCYLPLLIIKLD